mgnify:CR=1 FL=1
MLDILQQFADRLIKHTEDAHAAKQRGVLSERDYAEWVQLNKRFALTLQQWIAEQDDKHTRRA